MVRTGKLVPRDPSKKVIGTGRFIKKPQPKVTPGRKLKPGQRRKIA